MDRRTLVLVLLLALLFILYQPILRWAGLGKYLEPQRRPVPAAVDTTRGDTTAPRAAGPSRTVPPAAPAARAELAPLPITAAGVLEKTASLETPLYRAVFSTRGARLLSVELKRYASASGVSAISGKAVRMKPGQLVPAGDRVVLAGGPLFGVDLGSGTATRSLAQAVYAVSESTDARGATRGITFTLRDSSGLLIRQTWRIVPETYALQLEVETRGIPESWRLSDYSLVMQSWPPFTETDRRTDTRYTRASSLIGSNLHHDTPPSLIKTPRSYEGAVEWAGVQSRYFICATAVERAVPRGVQERAEERPVAGAALRALAPNERPVVPVAVSSLVAALPPADRPVDRYLVYVGPDDLRILSRLGHGLARAVDLGWTWMRPISELLLRLLDWIFVVVRNYGIAILVLALLVRLVLYPLNAASLKSTRAVQRLQPEVKRLQEKYKNDAPAMNKALMDLYKENKVNPAGGCLPMIVQMPVLFALYQVLLYAIELRQAPFVGWIDDLSAPDTMFVLGGFPVHLLPLLMAASQLLLQKLTPTPPQQAPTAYMMTFFMLFIFWSMPSGLVFYWTVMNLATALQQWLVLRRDESVAVVVPEGGRKKARTG
ncbi:MAG TPA: membrane protein insertase YidC [Terriglobales bacterium]|nr:membrane protein insertase YidC [Terriglobales bacterium]